MDRHRKYWLVAASMILFPLTIGGLGAGGTVTSMGATAASADEHHGKGISSHPIDWQNPIFNAQVVSRPEEAAPLLDFPPSAPEEVGKPRRVLVTAPVSAARVDRVLSSEYDHPDYGRFLVIQAVSQTNETELAAIAARCLPETGCEAGASVEMLENGSVALLLQGPTATSITWLKGQVRFDVIGAAGDFTAEEARAVANAF